MMRPAEAGFALMALLSLANPGAENVVSSRRKDKKMLGSGQWGMSLRKWNLCLGFL